MKITLDTNPSHEELETIKNGIDKEAYNKRGLTKFEHFSLFLRDDSNKVQGGIVCLIYYGCLYIEELWVEEIHRKQNYGTKLVLEAETYALKRGCRMFTVNTMDFEARPFYEKLGYKIEFERAGYQNNSKLYFLIKKLL